MASPLRELVDAVWAGLSYAASHTQGTLPAGRESHRGNRHKGRPYSQACLNITEIAARLPQEKALFLPSHTRRRILGRVLEGLYAVSAWPFQAILLGEFDSGVYARDEPARDTAPVPPTMSD